MSDYQKFKEEQLQDAEFLAYCKEMEVPSTIAKAIVEGRMRLGISQKELSERTGIHQADISRLENCEGNPTVKMLKRIAAGLDMELQIAFVPSAVTDPDSL